MRTHDSPSVPSGHLPRFRGGGGFTLIHQPPDLPLQAGRLDHSLRHQITFRELRRTFRQIRFRPNFRRKFPRESRNTFGFIADGPELLMEHHCVEFIVILNQVFLRVLGLEEHRIREARRDNFAIPRLNRLAAIGRDLISDNDKMRRELAAFGIAYGKCLLMRFQRQANDFVGQLQKTLVHIAEQNHGPFREACDFIEQAFILNEFQTLRRTELRRFGFDKGFAGLVGQHHMPLALQRIDIILERGNHKRPRPMTAVPHCCVGRCDTANGDIHNRAAEQHDHPAQGPHPAKSRAAGFHRLRPWEAIHDIGDELLENDVRIAACALHHGDIKFAFLGVRADFRFGNILEASGFHKAFERPFRRAHTRAFALLGHIRRTQRQIRDKCQAARARQNFRIFNR